MPNKFITWLKGLIPSRSQNETQQIPSSSNHVELTRQHITNTIVNALKPMRDANNIKVLTLWAPDARAYEILSSGDTIEQLRLSLDNALLTTLANRPIHVREGRPKEGAASTLVMKDQLYMTFADPAEGEEQSEGVRCSLSIVDGKGSMEKDAYVLEARNGETRFYIGRGATGNRYGYRQNDIVVKTDDPDKVVQGLNNHVSSSHAVIIAAEGKFFLQVLPGGCRYTNGNPTKVTHNNVTVEIMDINMRRQLHDGDIIELGKKVLLKVSIGQPEDLPPASQE